LIGRQIRDQLPRSCALDRSAAPDLAGSMSTLTNSIATLRTALRTADTADPHSFSKVFHAFFDISDGPDLMDASQPVEDPVIRAMIESTARKHARDEAIVLTSFLTLRHGPTGLVHGGFFAGMLAGTFFYFEADKQGLVCFNDGTPMTHYYRITATVLPPGTMPIMTRKAGRSHDA
jgi:hypothetical protein